MSTNTQNNAPVSAERAEADERKDFAKWYYREYGKSISTFCKFGHSDWNKTEQKLFKVWAARAALSAPVAAQPDVTQQTLDDVMAGIPARDAEIEALRKQVETLQAQLVDRSPEMQAKPVDESPNLQSQQQPVSGADGLVRQLCDALELARDCHGVMLMSDPPQEMWKGRGVDLVISEALEAAKAQLSGNPGQLDHLPDTTKMVEQAGALSGQNQPETRKDTALEGGAQPSRISGELPKLTIQWHDTPEAVHRIFWEKAALENGMTYEELIEGTMVGETAHREKVELTYEQEIQAIRDQKCWGCADTDTNQVHVWAAPDVDRTLLIHMLAHEIGHLTGEPHTDDIQEELRAETFGKVAAMAYQMLQAQQDSLQAEVLDMVRMLESNEWADHCGQSELGKRLEWAITALQNRPQNIPEPAQRLIFPAMLRKMWSGSEVQAWLDDELAKLTKSSSQQDADKVDALPSLNDDLIAILGRPNFMCAQLADMLRSGGQEIAKRAESEQAAVIHFLLGHYLADPVQWAEKASAVLKAARKEQA